MRLIDEVLHLRQTLAPGVLAFKCHPSRYHLLVAVQERQLFWGLEHPLPVFTDPRLEPPVIIAAFTEAAVEAWRRDEYRRVLVRLLRWRAAQLEAQS